MKPRHSHHEILEETPSGPWAVRSLVPLAAAAVFFLFGVAGLAGVLPFAESSFHPSSTPVPGALGQSPQPLPTQFVARNEHEPTVLDLEPIFDLLRPPFILPAVAATATPAASVFSVSSGAVRAVEAPAPTATPTAVPTATPTTPPTSTPVPPTQMPEPTATPVPDTPVPPQPAAGSWNPAKPEVALFDPSQPVETPAVDGDYGGYSTLPPPQE